jgi:hypothetical protein
MLKFVFLMFATIGQVNSHPPSVNGCCIDHPRKPNIPTFIGNYECSQLDEFGKTRCNEVFTGKTCIWKTGKKCSLVESKLCHRIPRYEMHYNKVVDVGRCVGQCTEDEHSCSPSKYVIKALERGKIEDVAGVDILPASKKIRIIEECDCDNCGVVESTQLIKIPQGRCFGNCNQNQDNKVCMAGLNDNYAGGPEPSYPSSLLLSGILSQCSAGVQSGFDIFTDNRCFGHTFTNCLMKGECPLKRAILHICIKAAQVPLTNTDSLILGVNGGALWGKSLPVLNGGMWNPNDNMCLDLDLDNLPGGISILNTLDSVGHLDVVVQDDSAVDFVQLSIEYEKCLDCIPAKSVMNTLYTVDGVSEFTHVTDCDCVNATKCHKEEHLQTFYPGTMYEQTFDVGQCLGKCDSGLVCKPNKDDTKIIKIKTPHGVREISLINTCDCMKLKWNVNAEKI